MTIADERECPVCGAQVDIYAIECPVCGAAVEPLPVDEIPEEEKSLCPSCGKIVSIRAPVCPYCGEVFEMEDEAVSEGLMESLAEDTGEDETVLEIDMSEAVDEATDEDSGILIDETGVPVEAAPEENLEILAETDEDDSGPEVNITEFSDASEIVEGDSAPDIQPEDEDILEAEEPDVFDEETEAVYDEGDNTSAESPSLPVEESIEKDVKEEIAEESTPARAPPEPEKDEGKDDFSYEDIEDLVDEGKIKMDRNILISSLLLIVFGNLLLGFLAYGHNFTGFPANLYVGYGYKDSMMGLVGFVMFLTGVLGLAYLLMKRKYRHCSFCSAELDPENIVEGVTDDDPTPHEYVVCPNCGLAVCKAEEFEERDENLKKMFFGILYIYFGLVLYYASSVWHNIELNKHDVTGAPMGMGPTLLSLLGTLLFFFGAFYLVYYFKIERDSEELEVRKQTKNMLYWSLLLFLGGNIGLSLGSLASSSVLSFLFTAMVIFGLVLFFYTASEERKYYLSEGAGFCPACGEPVDDTDDICPACGADLEPGREPEIAPEGVSEEKEIAPPVEQIIIKPHGRPPVAKETAEEEVESEEIEEPEAEELPEEEEIEEFVPAAETPPEETVCPTCAADIAPGAKECPICGTILVKEEEAEEEEEKDQEPTEVSEEAEEPETPEEDEIPAEPADLPLNCPVCGADVTPTETSCPICGAELIPVEEPGTEEGEGEVTEAAEEEKDTAPVVDIEDIDEDEDEPAAADESATGEFEEIESEAEPEVVSEDSAEPEEEAGEALTEEPNTPASPEEVIPPEAPEEAAEVERECPTCGAGVSPEDTVCAVCGAEIPQQNGAEDTDEEEKDAGGEDEVAAETPPPAPEDDTGVEDEVGADEDEGAGDELPEQDIDSEEEEGAEHTECPICGATVEPYDESCPVCGADLKNG